MSSQFSRYDPSLVRRLQQHLAPERFSTYLTACDDDPMAAMALYDWNIELAMALWGDLQRLEVVLRNAMNNQLTAKYGPAWFDRPGLLTAERRTDLGKARSRLKRMRRTETPGRIVAELSFGFWRYLLIKKEEKRLWRPALHQAFPYMKPRRRHEVERRVARGHELRNRIGHCEPVFARDLETDLRDLEAVAGYVHPEVAQWITDASSVRAVITRRPAP